MVFFVLSGFFIGWAVVGGIRSGKWSWRGYLVRRLTRLGIVLLPALILTALWDLAGMSLFGVHSAYLGGRAGDSVLTFRVLDNLTVQGFLGNLLFLQGIHEMPTFGSNAPLWSLSYEFWYYMLFPLMVSAYFARGRLRWALALTAALVLVLIGPTIASYYLIWLMGVIIVLAALHLSPRQRGLPGWVLIPASLGLLLGVIVTQRHLLPAGEALLGVACAIFLAAIVLRAYPHDLRSRWRRPYALVARRMAGCSYTLYLVHLPVLVFLRAALGRSGPWAPDSLHIAYGLAMLIAVCGYALVVANLTEARTDQLRRWLVGRFPALT
jgi:peptidoglycan/LPS O-acetylase OafA/YrhL